MLPWIIFGAVFGAPAGLIGLAIYAHARALQANDRDHGDWTKPVIRRQE